MNPADLITKSKPSGVLKSLIDTNKVQLEEKDWVERGGDGGHGYTKPS